MAGLRAILAGAAGAVMLATTPVAFANDAAESFNRQVSETTVSPEVQAQIEAVEAQAREDALNGTAVILINPEDISELYYTGLQGYYDRNGNNPYGVSIRFTSGQSRLIHPFTDPEVMIHDIEGDGLSLVDGTVVIYINDLYEFLESQNLPVVTASLN